MKILFPIDGLQTATSTAASTYLISRRWESGTKIKVIAVVKPHESLLAMFGKFGQSVEREQFLYQYGLSCSGYTAELQKELPHCEVTFELLEGDPADMILQEAENWKSDLIILGSHDRQSLKRRLLGGVSHAVSSHANCPVMIAKHPLHDEPHEISPRMTRVLVPCDGSHSSIAALKWIAQLHWHEETEVVFLAVIDHVQDKYAKEADPQKATDIMFLWQERRQHLQKSLTELAEHLEKVSELKHIDVKIIAGDPREAIVKYANEWRADLIVIGSHGHTRLSMLFLGSVAQAVVTHAHCAVEVIKTCQDDEIVALQDSYLESQEYDADEVKEDLNEVRPMDNLHIPPTGMM